MHRFAYVFKLPGTSLLIIRWAIPSTIAVLPTPGSPINTGLFLVRRDKICITRRISSWRPITDLIYLHEQLLLYLCNIFQVFDIVFSAF